MLKNAKALKALLDQTGLPVFYGTSKGQVAPPYIVYLGSGQNNMPADDTLYWKENTYQIEYYYRLKNEDSEAAIEDLLLGAGLIYTKSDDVYISDGEMYVIYYDI